MEREAKDLLEEKVEQYSRDEEVIEMYSEYARAELETESVLEEAKEKAEARGLERGREEGIKQGREEGTQKNQVEIARRMLEDDLDVELIAKYTKCSIEEIRSLEKGIQ